MNQTELTGRLRDVLHKIAELENAGGLVTTHRLASELTQARQNIWMYVQKLSERGLIIYNPTKYFTTPIQLSEAGWRVSDVPRAAKADLRFPILGEIAAGQPTLADAQVEAYATRLQDVLDLREGDFLLKVRGDSMIGIGIYPGDLVAIRPQDEEPLSGEITLVTIPGDNTATLKRWHRDNGTVTLTSEHADSDKPDSKYGPMKRKVQDVLIQGCLVGHIGTGRSRRNGNGMTCPPES